MAQVAEQTTSINTAVNRPYVNSAPTMPRRVPASLTAPKFGLTSLTASGDRITVTRCRSGSMVATQGSRTGFVGQSANGHVLPRELTDRAVADVFAGARGLEDPVAA